MSPYWGGEMSKRRWLGVHAVVRLGLACAITACTSVDIVRLTSQQFPAKTSDTEVDVLEREPARAHIPLAALRVKSSVSSFEAMLRKILKKAAALGADAVVFAKSQSQCAMRRLMTGDHIVPGASTVHITMGPGLGTVFRVGEVVTARTQ